MTIRTTLQHAASALEGSTDQPRLEAILLLGHSLGRSHSWLIAHDDEVCDESAQRDFEALLQRRCQGVPMAYITGEREFWSLPLQVCPDVLVPRPETELLVEAALARIPADSPRLVVDLGTGSGAIAIALAVERPAVEVFATELSAAAIGVAMKNAARHCPQRIRFLHGPWFGPLQGRRFDIIVSNPPYVPEQDPHLEALVHEPACALVAGPDGLDDLRRVIADAPAHLQPHGWLMVEHGADQAHAVHALLRAAGFGQITTLADLAGRDRVSQGRLK